MGLEEELSALDNRIRKLRVQWDLFFTGNLPKPPCDARDELDKAIKRLGSLREMKLSQRFLYNNLLNRWNLFTELWNKRMQEREEGARTPAAAIRRKVAAATSAPAAGLADTRPLGSAAEKGLVARAAIRDAVDTSDELKAFYRKFLDAQHEVGTRKPPSFEKFCKEIGKHLDAIRQKSSCERVDFRIYLLDNKISLKAKPLKDEDVA
jgi:hypothetical protein